MRVRIAGKSISINDDLKFSSFDEFVGYVGERIPRLEKGKLKKVLKPIYNERNKSINITKKVTKGNKSNADSSSKELGKK